MEIKQQLLRSKKSAQELFLAIENESWDEALLYSQDWDESIRKIFNNLPADQFKAYEKQVEEIILQNRIIQNALIELRAKVLTELQETNYSRTAIQQYTHLT